MNRLLSILSIVVPCHNEEEVLDATHGRLTVIAQGLRDQQKIKDYEIVLVNNGSTDATMGVMQRIFQKDRRVVIVDLRRNFGYQASITAGLEHAAGDAVVTIDADLQDPPEKIGDMVDLCAQGHDLVLGVRQSRRADTFFKRVFSQFFYRFSKWMGVPVVYNHGDFRLIERSLLEQFKDMPERSRFIRAMIFYLDHRYGIVPYDRQERQSGTTKFNVSALWGLAMDGIFSYSYFPLRVISIFGLCVSLAAMVLGGCVIYIKFKMHVFPGWASTILPVVFFGGIQCLFLGVIGEYIGRLYVEIKGRPLYAVRKIHKH